MSYTNWYDVIGRKICKWCDETGYDHVIARIRCGDMIYNELMLFDGYTLEWENDWFEGEKDVELLGVIRVMDVNNGFTVI